MGLDMYLRCNDRLLCKDVAEELNDSHHWHSGTVVYWRKANAIHKWFVDNVQHGTDDCGVYDVDIRQLKDLRDMCEAVLSSTRLVEGDAVNGQTVKDGKWSDNIERGRLLEDTSVAERLLPTADGFFFGSTAYDQWYWEDLEYTMRALGAILSRIRTVKGDFGFAHEVYGDDDWYIYFTYKSSW